MGRGSGKVGASGKGSTVNSGAPETPFKLVTGNLPERGRRWMGGRLDGDFPVLVGVSFEETRLPH